MGADLEPLVEVRREVVTKLGEGGSVWTTWCLHGQGGAIVFRLRTGRGFDDLPWGIDSHRRSPGPWQSQEDGRPDCGFLDGATCWSDGSALQAHELWKTVRALDPEEAEALIWSTLGDRYARWIEDRDEADELTSQGQEVQD